MRRYIKKRPWGRYGKKKRFGKMGYRKMKRGKAKLYRQGGNYAQPVGGKPSVELKSQDILVSTIATYDGATALANPVGSVSRQCYDVQPYKAACENFANQFVPALTASYGYFVQGVSTGVMSPLNSLSVGSGLNQRIGRKITMRSFKFDGVFNGPCGTLTANSVAGWSKGTPSVSAPVLLRIMVVYDRQTNGAPVQLSDVLASPGAAGLVGSGQVTVSSSNNLNNRSRFLTIFDKVYSFGNADTTAKRISIYKKLNLPVIYTSNGPGANVYDVSQISTGGLFMAFISDCNAPLAGNATGALNSPWAVCPSVRIRFTDA